MAYDQTENIGAATGGVRELLRWEGVALLAGMTLFYWISGGSWLLYALVFFVPDLSFIAYLAGPRIGAGVYNAMHATIAPLCLVLAGLATAEPIAGLLAMVWLAHIGFDRMLGYGLKYEAGFGFTHLGRVGKTVPQPERKVVAPAQAPAQAPAAGNIGTIA